MLDIVLTHIGEKIEGMWVAFIIPQYIEFFYSRTEGFALWIALGTECLTGSGWPDIVVALGLVILLFRSAIRVITSALRELRAVQSL